MSSAAMAGTETGQELAAQTGYGGAGWAGPSGVGGEPVAGSVALTGENPISSGWIGMVGSGIGLSTKALNKALHKGKACIRALKPWIRAKEREQTEYALGKNKMKPTNPNAHTYVNGTDVKTHGYAITQNTFLQ